MNDSVKVAAVIIAGFVGGGIMAALQIYGMIPDWVRLIVPG